MSSSENRFNVAAGTMRQPCQSTLPMTFHRLFRSVVISNAEDSHKTSQETYKNCGKENFDHRSSTWCIRHFESGIRCRLPLPPNFRICRDFVFLLAHMIADWSELRSLSGKGCLMLLLNYYVLLNCVPHVVVGSGEIPKRHIKAKPIGIPS